MIEPSTGAHYLGFFIKMANRSPCLGQRTRVAETHC